MEYLKVWTSFAEVLEPLTDEERGRLFMAMLIYSDRQELTELTGNERFVWATAKQSIDWAREVSENNAANGRKGGRPKSEAKRTEANETEKKRNKATESEQNRSKANESLKDKDKVNSSPGSGSTRTRETEFGEIEVDPVIIAVQSELTGMTGDHYQELEEFRKELPDELIIEAVNEAVAHGTRFWSYVRAVLRRYIREGIRTIGEAREEHERRNENTGGDRRRHPRDPQGDRKADDDFDLSTLECVRL